MRDDVAKYMKYYNVERLHSANADQSPIDFEISFRKVSGWTWPEQFVVERFFGSLKHDWLLKVPQPTRQHMRDDVAKYMRYYNVERLYSANADQSPIDLEISFRKVSGWTWPEHLYNHKWANSK